MLISKTNEAMYVGVVNGALSGFRAKIVNTSVKLISTSGGTFTASGVILYANGGTTTIVTAKHVLYSRTGATEPPAWSDQLVTDFVSKVTIYYGGANLAYNVSPTQTAAIATANPVTQGNGTPDWAYDVMILTSTDVNLSTFATTNKIGATGNAQVKTLLTTPGLFLQKAQGKTYFVATGYGKVRDKPDNKKSVTMPTDTAGSNQTGRLQYILTPPTDKQTITVYNKRASTGYYSFDDAIVLTADANSSTSEGDSGGPIFFVSIDKPPRICVIGVSTGSNMLPTQTVCPGPNDPYLVNNIATSLAYCYDNGVLNA